MQQVWTFYEPFMKLLWTFFGLKSVIASHLNLKWTFSSKNSVAKAKQGAALTRIATNYFHELPLIIKCNYIDVVEQSNLLQKDSFMNQTSSCLVEYLPHPVYVVTNRSAYLLGIIQQVNRIE